MVQLGKKHSDLSEQWEDGKNKISSSRSKDLEVVKELMEKLQTLFQIQEKMYDRRFRKVQGGVAAMAKILSLDEESSDFFIRMIIYLTIELLNLIKLRSTGNQPRKRDGRIAAKWKPISSLRRAFTILNSNRHHKSQSEMCHRTIWNKSDPSWGGVASWGRNSRKFCSLERRRKCGHLHSVYKFITTYE